MNLQQLTYFSCIVEKKGFSKAARELNVSQSTLSHAIHELETELHAPLLDRLGKGLQLTPYGSVFLEHIDPALAEIAAGTKKVRDMVDPDSGEISVCSLSSLNGLLTYAVSSYNMNLRKYFSKFRFITATHRELETMLETGACDLGFTMVTDNPNLDFLPLCPLETVIAVSKQHPLSRYKEVHLRQLRNEHIVSYAGNTIIREYHNSLFRMANFVPNIVFESVNDNVILSVVGSNVGVALLPRPLENIPDNVALIHILDDIPARTVAIARNANRFLPKSSATFAKFISDHKEEVVSFIQNPQR